MSRERSLTGRDESQWAGPFTFVQAADTQLGFSPDPTWDGGGPGDGSNWDEEIELSERLVRCVNALRPAPRFLVVCGDLVHALPPGLKTESEGGRPSVDRYANTDYWKRQNADFKRIMRKLKVPLVCVCGNHDVGDRPTPEAIARYEEQHGDNYFGFWCGGMRGLVLNAQTFGDSTDAAEMHAEQCRWFDSELSNLNDGSNKHKKHAVVFQHIPWFLRNEAEPREGYFNLPETVRAEWLLKMRAAGVSKVFCGHYHRNAGAYTDDRRLEVVVTSAVGRQMSAAEVASNKSLVGTPEGVSDTKSGMRVVTVREASIDHTYHEFDTLEQELGLSEASIRQRRMRLLTCVAGGASVGALAWWYVRRARHR